MWPLTTAGWRFEVDGHGCLMPEGSKGSDGGTLLGQDANVPASLEKFQDRKREKEKSPRSAKKKRKKRKAAKT